jgi:2'-5' RNA ligase
VPEANIHLTLKFLGQTHPQKLPEIKRRMGNIAGRNKRFQFSLGKIGVFPHLKNPRVLWLGVEEREAGLRTLQKKIEKSMAEMGFPEDTREQTPHITLARIKEVQKKNKLQERIESFVRVSSNHPVDVTMVSLIESELTPSGAVYTVLERFHLNQLSSIQ